MNAAAARSSMAGMPMRGLAAMSSPWLPAANERWVDAGASFVVMWLVMTAAMMLPAAAPALWRYRRAVAWRGAGYRDLLAAAAGAAYLFVWGVCGLLAFVVGASAAMFQAAHPSVAHVAPLATGVLCLLAGAWQLTAHKARHLASCRRDPVASGMTSGDAGAAARFGLRLGLDCTRSCANLMLVPLVAGIMDVPVMAAVGLAIAAERLAPSGARIARVTGVVVIVTGLYPIARLAMQLTAHPLGFR